MLYSLRDVTEFKKQKSAIGTHTQKNRNKGDKSGKDERETKREKLKYLSGTWRIKKTLKKLKGKEKRRESKEAWEEREKEKG